MNTITCHSVNDVAGRVMPSLHFPWTNALVGGARHRPSPFSGVRGSPVHRTMVEATCSSIRLSGTDPDGDEVNFAIVTSLPKGGRFDGEVVTYCAPRRLHELDGPRDVEVEFDVCDSVGLCSSRAAGTNKVIFHVSFFLSAFCC